MSEDFRKEQLRLIGLALSTSNLILLSTWSELLFRHEGSNYYMLSPPGWTDYLGGVANMLLLAASFLVAVRLVQKTHTPWLSAAAKVLFLAALLIPLNTLRLGLPERFGVGALVGRLRATGLLIPALAVLGVLGLAALRYRRAVFQVASTIILVMAPFAAITGGQAMLKAGKAFTAPPDTPASFARTTTSTITEPRVVWMIFDELDNSAAYTQRPEGLELPSFDRLKRESISVARALPPSRSTLISIPALLTGARIKSASPAGLSDLKVTLEDRSEPIALTSLKTVFDHARAAGFSTTAVGYYHPYCRLFERSLDRCTWRPVYQTVSGQVPAEEKRLSSSMRAQLQAILPINPRLIAERTYLRLLAEGKDAAARSPGLAFVHLNMPHPPAIFDRKKNDFSSFVLSNIAGYIDNLVLADRGLSEIRAAMEEAGTWDKTTVIVTSDHVWREKAAYDGRKDPYVPFLLKLPGPPSPGTELDLELETVHASELVLAILKREVPDAAAASRWLETHARTSTGASGR